MKKKQSANVWHSIPLIGQPRAILYAPQPLSQHNVRQLRKWIDLMEEALTTPQKSNTES